MQIGRSLGVLLAAGLPALQAAAQEAPPAPDATVEAWIKSPHADAAAESFTHWDAEGEIPGDCAVCHSTSGFAEFVAGGATGLPVLGHPVGTGGTIECNACHAEGAPALPPVAFPSGATAASMGPSAVCTVCHQGRAAGRDVDEAVGDLDADTVSADLAFVNVHYSAAAATLLGAAAHGGYEYPGQSYAGRFDHVAPLDTCIGCHGAHDTAVALESCTSCHQDVAGFADIRTTQGDLDGDGDAAEGIGQVVADLHDRLAAEIAAYAAGVAGAPIAYDASRYPYFFADSDADGRVGADEAGFPNRYQSWTPRLLKAAYNYQFVGKDGGAFAHNAHYAIQLTIDSIADLAVRTGTDTTSLVRP